MGADDRIVWLMTEAEGDVDAKYIRTKFCKHAGINVNKPFLTCMYKIKIKKNLPVVPELNCSLLFTLRSSVFEPCLDIAVIKSTLDIQPHRVAAAFADLP